MLAELSSSVPNPPHKLQSTWVNVLGRKVHARVSPNAGETGKPSVVLVHGLVVSSKYLVPTGELLAGDFDVYAPDLPGFGRSEEPDGFDTVETLAEWLICYLDTIGLERPSFLANSMGCQVIVEAALRYPHRVRNIVLSGPVIDPHARTIPIQIMRSLKVYPRERLTLVGIHAVDYFQAGPRRLLRTLRAMLNYPIEKKLPCIHDPVLVVRGQYDALVPQYWAEEVAALLPQGRLIVLPGAAHTTNYSHPLELVRVSRPFLKRTGSHR